VRAHTLIGLQAPRHRVPVGAQLSWHLREGLGERRKARPKRNGREDTGATSVEGQQHVEHGLLQRLLSVQRWVAQRRHLGRGGGISLGGGGGGRSESWSLSRGGVPKREQAGVCYQDKVCPALPRLTSLTTTVAHSPQPLPLTDTLTSAAKRW